MKRLQIQLFGGRGSRSGLGVGGRKTNANISSDNISKPAIRLNEKSCKNLDEWENKIRQYGVEILVVCDENEKPIHAYSSEETTRVNLPHYKYSEFENMIVTHNHPYNTTFSFDDILIMVINNFKEIRAVVSDGVFVFSKTRDFDFDNDNNFFNEINRYEKQCEFKFEPLKTILQEQYDNGKLEFNDYFQKLYNYHREIYGACYNELCLKYGFKYEFIKK